MQTFSAPGTAWEPDGDMDAFPPELEFDRAVDRLEAAPWNVKDWNMIVRTIRRIEKFSGSAILQQQLASKPRIVA